MRYRSSFVLLFVLMWAGQLHADQDAIQGNVTFLQGSTVRGDRISLLLRLPSRDKNIKKWVLYVQSGEREFDGGELPEKPSFKQLSFKGDRVGQHKAVLYFVTSTGAIAFGGSDQIRVEHGPLLELIKNWGGILLGAAIATLIFIAQESLKSLY